MARRHKQIRDEIFEELIDFFGSTTPDGADLLRDDLRSAIHEVTAKAADALGFEVPRFAQDRAEAPPSSAPPPDQERRQRYASVGPEQFLVYEIVESRGKPKGRWHVFKADEPGVSVERFVDSYIADKSVIAMMVFQGSMVFRDARRIPGTQRAEDP